MNEKMHGSMDEGLAGFSLAWLGLASSLPPLSVLGPWGISQDWNKDKRGRKANERFAAVQTACWVHILVTCFYIYSCQLQRARIPLRQCCSYSLDRWNPSNKILSKISIKRIKNQNGSKSRG